MKKPHKLTRLEVGCILILFVIVLFLCIGTGRNLFSDATPAKRAIDRDEKYITIVSDYLTALDYHDIYIPVMSEAVGMMYVDGGYAREIEDEEVLQSIRILKWRGYEVISRENNAIMFQIWSTRHVGRGIARTIDGETPETPYMTQCEPLTHEWFYYEEE